MCYYKGRGKGPPHSVDLYVICGWGDSCGWTRFRPKEVSANKIFAQCSNTEAFSFYDI